ncbi:MAG: DUF418 domain-containing protein [Actinomycetota bacterium]|nr:DUF418 domain-containing protein [Actinomycetota bacterium]
MSNTVWWVYGLDPGHLVWDSVDRWTGALGVIFISGRAYPMFSFLFGYGIVQMLSHLAARGVSRRRAETVVIRRNVTLVGLGFLHALFLFSGDVLGAYGLLGFICLVLARQRPYSIALVAVTFLAFRVLYDYHGWVWQWVDLSLSQEVASAATYGGAMGLRVRDWLSGWAVLPYYLAPMIFGVLAARHRILEEPVKHRRLLIVTIVGGFALSILSGLPDALVALDRWQPSGARTWQYISTIGEAGGIAGGIALAALASLLTSYVGRSGVLHRFLEPVRCLGRRSLSGYLFQSFAFVLIFPAYTLGLGGKSGITACYLIALAVWGLSLVLATLLERSGRTGPGEWLMRRAAYGAQKVRP